MNTLSAVGASAFGAGANFVQINDITGTGTAALTLNAGVAQTLGNGITMVSADTATVGSATVVNIGAGATLTLLQTPGSVSPNVVAPPAGVPLAAAVWVVNNTTTVALPGGINTALIAGPGTLSLGGALANFNVQGSLGQPASPLVPPAPLAAPFPFAPVSSLVSTAVGGVAFGDLTVSAVVANGGVAINGVASGALVGGVANAGRVLFTAANTYAGATNVNSGTLQIGDDATGSINAGSLVTIAPGASLDLALAPALAVGQGHFSNIVFNSGWLNAIGVNINFIDGPVLGAGALNQVGTGRTILTNTNLYTGGTNVRAGSLDIGNGVGGTIAAASAVTVSGGATLNINMATGATLGNGIANTGTINGLATGTNTLSGIISGAGVFNQGNAAVALPPGVVGPLGTGRTILTGNNTYTGATTVNSGTLQIGDGVTAGTSIAPSGQVQVNAGGTLAINLATGGTFANGVNLLAANSALNTIQAGTNTLSGAIVGLGTLSQTGTGTTILTNAGNTYAGATTVSAGTLQIGTAGTAGSVGAGNISVRTGGTLLVVNIGGPVVNVLANNISNTVGGAGSVSVNSANTNTLSGILSDGGGGVLSLTSNTTGGSFTILTGANTYSGGTTVATGFLSVGNASVSGGANAGATAGTGLVTVNAGATLFVDLLNGETFANNVQNNGNVSTAAFAPSTQTISGNITGGGTFSHDPNGTGGTTNLTGNNNYTGATTVGNGAVASTLLVNGSLGNTTVTVNNLATLGGTGTIAGAVNVLAGGILAPGNSPGTITTGNLTLNAGSNSNFELRVPGTIGGGVNDLVNVNGNLVINAGAILNITPLAAPLPAFTSGSYRLFNYTGALTYAAGNFVRLRSA